jgi:hypothetical protein
MWSIETFFEIHLNGKIIKIPNRSFLTDNELFIVSEDYIVKSHSGWTISHHSLVYQLLMPYTTDSSIIIKKQEKYRIMQVAKDNVELLPFQL